MTGRFLHRERLFDRRIIPLLSSLFLPNSIRNRIFLGVIIIGILGWLLTFLVPAWVAFVLYAAGINALLWHLMERPVRSILALTRQGSSLSTAPDAALGGRDEFTRIARAILGMSSRMQQSIQEARVQTSRLDEIFSAMGDGVIIVSAEGKVLKVNNTVRRWLGCYDEVAGRRLVELIRSVELSEKIARLAASSDSQMGTGTVGTSEIIDSLHLQGTETRIVRAKIVFTRMAQASPVFLVFLFDLTDIHRLQELRREFFANASHELKTPIAAVRGYGEALLDMPDLQTNEMAKNFLGVILRNAGQLTKLIDEMLVLAGLESGSLSLHIQEYNVHNAVAKVFETIGPKAAEARVELIQDIAPDIDEILVDPQRFDSVLLNLVDNGIKYNREGGYVKISVRQNETDYLFFVEDSGVGIPDSAQPRAFERFYRVDKAHTRLGGGSGLGLAIVKHIVQAHGGAIWLRSEVGAGTVFSLTLPKKPRQKKINALQPW